MFERNIFREFITGLTGEYINNRPFCLPCRVVSDELCRCLTEGSYNKETTLEENRAWNRSPQSAPEIKDLIRQFPHFLGASAFRGTVRADISSS